MEALRQTCETLLREERVRADAAVSELAKETAFKEKRLLNENKRLAEVHICFNSPSF
jgi:hypothetical protein